MSLRDKLNQNPAIVSGAVLVLIVVLGIFIGINSCSGGGPVNGSAAVQYFFTTDDGATYFADDARKVPPFDKDGKPAVLCKVYTCDAGKTKFVAYLKRYTADAKKKLEDAQKASNTDGALMETIAMTGVEIKAPKTGDKGWVKQQSNFAEYSKIITITCPAGAGRQEDLEEVIPQ